MRHRVRRGRDGLQVLQLVRVLCGGWRNALAAPRGTGDPAAAGGSIILGFPLFRI